MTGRRIGLAAYYNQVQGRRGFGLAPHHYPLVAALEDERIPNVLMMLAAGAGKSNLIDIVWPTWLLGHDPTLTILSVSAGERLPQTFLQATMQVIQRDPAFRSLFPKVKPDVGVGWSLERGLYVVGHHGGDENPSYFCAGLGSKALTGLHARVLIFDDLHDEENSRTPEGRAEVVGRYYRTLLDRSDPRGTRRVAIGRWWAEDDLYQEWMRSGDWVTMELPATRPGGSRRLWYDVTVPDGVECVFTETAEPSPPEEQRPGATRYRAYYAAVDPTGLGFYWPASPTKRRNYLTVRRRQPRTAAVNYDGDMTGGGTGVFAEADFRPYVPPADLSLGIQSPSVRAWVRGMRGEVEEAWDTALGQPQSASMTAALTALLVPCDQWHRGEDPALVGPCDRHFDVYILDLMVEDLDARQLAMALRTRFGKWHPRMVTVEEKQSGVGLLQTFRGMQIPLRGQKVVEGKVERAVNPILAAENGLPVAGGAASVQGWVKMGRVLVPLGEPWLTGAHGGASEGFLRRVCAFAGGSRAADEFDALVHMVTRAIVCSGQVVYIPGMSGAAGDAAVPPPPFGADDPRAAAMEAFRALAGAGAAAAGGGEFGGESPFQGLCGAPCHFYEVRLNAERCRHKQHPKIVHSLEGCPDWARHGTVVEDDAA